MIINRGFIIMCVGIILVVALLHMLYVYLDWNKHARRYQVGIELREITCGKVIKFHIIIKALSKQDATEYCLNKYFTNTHDVIITYINEVK